MATEIHIPDTNVFGQLEEMTSEAKKQNWVSDYPSDNEKKVKGRSLVFDESKHSKAETTALVRIDLATKISLEEYKLYLAKNGQKSSIGDIISVAVEEYLVRNMI